MNAYLNLYYLTIYEFQNNPEINRKLMDLFVFSFLLYSYPLPVYTLHLSEIVIGSPKGEILKTDLYSIL